MICLETLFEARRVERQLCDAGQGAPAWDAMGRYAPPVPARRVRPRHAPARHHLGQFAPVVLIGLGACLALLRLPLSI